MSRGGKAFTAASPARPATGANAPRPPPSGMMLHPRIASTRRSCRTRESVEGPAV